MRLSDILSSGDGSGDDLKRLWNDTEAAGEMAPLPAGEYVSHIVDGSLATSRTNATPGYKLTFKVLEPEPFAGRMFWLDCWLTPAALPQSKRDLGKLGVASLEQLERPLPKFIRCKVKLALRKDDDGTERNRVRSFEVVGIDKPEEDPFAPGAVVVDGPKRPPELPTHATAAPPTQEGGANVVPF